MKTILDKFFYVESTGADCTVFIPKAEFKVILNDSFLVWDIIFRDGEYWVTYFGVRGKTSRAIEDGGAEFFSAYSLTNLN